MDPVLSYDFDQIEYTVRQEIHATHGRLNAVLDELRAQKKTIATIGSQFGARRIRVFGMLILLAGLWQFVSTRVLDASTATLLPPVMGSGLR